LTSAIYISDTKKVEFLRETAVTLSTGKIISLIDLMRLFFLPIVANDYSFRLFKVCFILASTAIELMKVSHIIDPFTVLCRIYQLDIPQFQRLWETSMNSPIEKYQEMFRQEGRQEGELKGELKNTLKTLKKAKEAGLDRQLICQLLDLTEEVLANFEKLLDSSGQEAKV
jgi:hypothetical protein